MPLKLRRAFFYTYVGLFLILAPLVVLYTAGYRFNFRTLRLAQVGALSITSIPKGATIWLDDKALSSRTPMLAKRTLPGTYDLKLTKDGYTSWGRMIEVKSRETTVVDNATLFLQMEPVNMQTLDPAVSAAASDGSVVAYALKTDPWLELWVRDTGSGRLTLLDRVSVKEFSQPQIHFTHDNYLLILDDASTNESKRRYYTKNGAVEKIPEWFAMYHFVSENGAEVLTKTSGSTSSITARLPEGNYLIDDVFNNILLVRDRSRERILLIDAATSGPPILLNIAADWARFEGMRLYVSDGFELHRYDINTNTDTLITRSGTRIQTVMPYLEGETLLVVSETGVIASDISDRSQPVNTTIFSADHLQSFWIDSRGKFGYAFATVEGVAGLYQIPLNK